MISLRIIARFIPRVVLVSVLSIGSLIVIFSENLLGIMTDNALIIAIGKEQLITVCFTHFITSLMEVFSFSLRALKRPNCTMVVGFICGFGVRTFWVTAIWELVGRTVGTLYLAYGVSAFCALVIYIALFIQTMKRETLLIKESDI